MQLENETIADALRDENERLYRQVVVTHRITGRTLTLDEAREVCALADMSLNRGRKR